MATFAQFMKKNKIEKPNVFYPATKSLCDEAGKPLQWELKAVTTKEANKLQAECTVRKKSKNGQTILDFDSDTYLLKFVCAAVVSPNLNDAELQNSYGVMSPEELLVEMVDNSGEYTALSNKVQEISGLTTLREDVEEAKN